MSRRCAVCNSEDSLTLVEFPITEPSCLEVEQSLRVVSCKLCGFVFNDVERSQVDFDESYELHSKYSNTSLYFSEADDLSVVADAPWDLARLSATAGFISEQFPKSTPILDIGSATAALLGFLKQDGFKDLMASDPSPRAIATASKRYEIDGLVGSLFDLPELTKKRFGLIVFSHVLEHIRDVKDALLSSHALLGDSGSIYIEVPDASRYSEYFIAPFHDFNTEHINHFTEVSLSNLVRSAGFEVVFIESGECLCSPSDLYPVIRMVARPMISVAPKDSTPGSEVNTVLEQEFEANIKSIRNFISKSEREISELLSHLLEVGGTQKVVCWGYGQLSYKLLPLLNNRLNVVAVTDGSEDKWGLPVPVLGLKVVPPHDIPCDCVVIVMSRHHTAAIVDAVEKKCPEARIVTLSASQ